MTMNKKVEKRCEGFARFKQSLEKYTPDYVAKICGLNNPDDIVAAAHLMATPPWPCIIPWV